MKIVKEGLQIHDWLELVCLKSHQIRSILMYYTESTSTDIETNKAKYAW